jgi:hypothetical protein
MLFLCFMYAAAASASAHVHNTSHRIASGTDRQVARRALAPSYVFAYFTFGNDMFKVS